ncbi:pyridoxamine 5'-phosphate oxidase family protein [Fimbriimonas ginsengisoli]|uniref:Pyridoxamine 5'-phosphate oxidase-related FMN-binding protein n=1 Tax=Fimbriimonas ginsengisoli Gsoil 348 TaxID=661478 RepID=A0A068NY31_FIMGI|nr:pyridoxamine 5'-phosphate oxidase family protein [Fimbriimonas ginsengisoli]AIE86594.1 pyridoxamine 5'-phosphate oxidase-related FMN-binding protein [Fimbriimonas ginsengisoli Gsoil 348]
MIKVLPEAEIWEVVDSCAHAHLGCYANGKSYVVPVSFVRDGNRIFGLTSAGLKIDMMRENPKVCLQFEEITSLTMWRSAILWGQFQELEGAERAQAAGAMFDKYGPGFEGTELRKGRDVTPPRLDHTPSPQIAYAITISEFSGRSEGS